MPIKKIADMFNISYSAVQRYNSYAKARLTSVDVPYNKRKCINKLIIKHIDELIKQNKYTRQRFNKPKAIIDKDDFYQFAMDICNNENSKDMAAVYGVALSTITSYRLYAKAVVSGNKDLGLKIYKCLNKNITKCIDYIIENKKYTNGVAYVSKSKTCPKQIGPKQKARFDMTDKPSLSIAAIVPTKLDLDSCAINTLPIVEQPKAKKEEAPVKEIIELLQSALKSIQDLIQKL